MPAWRARAHQLTRSRAFLARAAAVILGVAALVATLLHVSRQAENTGSVDGSYAGLHTAFQASFREDAKELESEKTPEPAQLLTLIRSAAAVWMIDEPEERSGFDAIALRLHGVELHPLINRHSTSAAQGDAVIAYVRYCFLPDGDARKSALQTLRDAASNAPPPLANEMYGDALDLSGAREQALRAYLRDVSTPDATHARARAFELALGERSKDALAQLCADKRVLAEIKPVALWAAAKLTGDRRLLFHALWLMGWDRWMQGAAVPLALFSAAIWYVILIHTASFESMRWWRYLGGVFAGIASVWLLHWWQGTLNYLGDLEHAPSLMHEILQWIMRVGLPEETAKLLLYSVFLPVLLHQRSAVKAALTAGCVGLGFALDENLHYFLDQGPQVAIGRLLTANFMHVALTGVLGWHLYELFRTRFHHATEFLAAFCLVATAHGVYDFSQGRAAREWGFDVSNIIILALSARFYLQLLHQHEQGRLAGHAISRTAVFVLGTALLGGMLMIVMVWEQRSLDGITMVLEQMVGLAIVALLYIREWHELA